MHKGIPSLMDLVSRLGELCRADQRTRAAEFQLQPIHVQAMQYVSRANRYSNTPRGVAEYLGLTKGTVSQTLIFLQRRGYLQRFVDADDHRVVRLALTDAGVLVLRETAQPQGWPHALRGISPARKRTALRVLSEIEVWIQSRHGIAFGTCPSCLHSTQEGPRRFRCGVTGDLLNVAETRRLCRLHESAQ